jgi:starch-binding outer membrane protein, SusD/RagB family
MMRNLIRYVSLAAVVGLGACSDNSLAVTNPNSGDTKRVLGTPVDAENLLGTYYKRWSNGVYGTTSANTTSVEGMINVMSLMNYSSLANNCQNSHFPFVGATNFNTPGNTCSGEQQRLYAVEGEVDRVASSFLAQVKAGLTLGSPAEDNRDKAFAEFLRGLSIGYVALLHDSTAVISDGTGAQDPGKLVGAKEAMDSAMAAFQRAIDLTNAPATGQGGFPIPPAWIPSPTSYTAAEFTRLIRSYRARLRASVARTPAERAAEDWTSIIADAQNGITSDQIITTSTTAGPYYGWRYQYNSFSTWHQMPAFIIGMADVSGSYAAWTAQPIGDRGAGNSDFFMVTPDLRFPQGATRAAQIADFQMASCAGASQTCKRYFVNRNGSDDFTGASWGFSNYDFVRFHSWATTGDGSSRNGNTPFMVKTEMDMLQAEGLIRKGDYAGAAALINVTRVKNGLPAITTFDATSPVPGGPNCVPKVPVGPAFNTVACGNIMEAMKYEKRIETAYTHFGAWYWDMRGWGDLPADTPLFYAVPYQDLQARGYAIPDLYGAGIGAGNAPGSAAVKGTYGW